jgi:hypothetical protein
MKIYSYKLNKENTVEASISSEGSWYHFSIYDYTDSKNISLECDRESLKGLADFIYNTIQMNVAHKVMAEDSEALGKLSK